MYVFVIKERGFNVAWECRLLPCCCEGSTGPSGCHWQPI